MTTMINKGRKKNQLAKTYLGMYKEYIEGYKQYKLEKAALYIAGEKTKRA
ncbi:hypothetical protein GPDM_01780 [Planococcus donghaensis MPA1U2]|uniref:Uncharacterized protein n=1 Tax=Planococcus donghaensis MPA1U2 TaxID=933115 RepID=E7RD28_9BACL|nr:hypothetical protein [Planococcus donghaensis]EGA91092.1 hypothetical protein GPDM_01780 [Planococcus donghaensis MPA1U2]